MAQPLVTYTDLFQTEVFVLPDIDSLNLFLRAVTLKSLSKAAEASNISLSAASRRLSLLEHQFGSALVDRLHTGVVPTPAGETLAIHAKTLINDVELMMTDLSDYALGAVGRVRVFANVSALNQELPEKFAEWSESNANIKLLIREMRSSEIVEAVRHGAADIGVVTTEPTTDLYFEHYSKDPLCVIAPAGSQLRAREVDFAELLAEDFVALEDSAASTMALKRAAQAAGKHLRIRVQVHSFEAVCRFVAAGFGIGIIPTGTAKSFKMTMKLKLVRLRDSWAERDMYLCFQKGRIPTATSRFAEYLLGRSLTPQLR